MKNLLYISLFPLNPYVKIKGTNKKQIVKINKFEKKNHL